MLFKDSRIKILPLIHCSAPDLCNIVYPPLTLQYHYMISSLQTLWIILQSKKEMKKALVFSKKLQSMNTTDNDSNNDAMIGDKRGQTVSQIVTSMIQIICNQSCKTRKQFKFSPTSKLYLHLDLLKGTKVANDPPEVKPEPPCGALLFSADSCQGI